MVNLQYVKRYLLRYPIVSLWRNFREKYPISSLGLFGSIVRDDFTEHSDIDIIVDFNDKIGIEFIALADELEVILNHKVDLVSRGGIKPK